jgi:hypothetical protein
MFADDILENLWVSKEENKETWYYNVLFSEVHTYTHQNKAHLF